MSHFSEAFKKSEIHASLQLTTKSLKPRLEPSRGNYCNHHSAKDTPKMPKFFAKGL